MKYNSGLPGHFEKKRYAGAIRKYFYQQLTAPMEILLDPSDGYEFAM